MSVVVLKMQNPYSAGFLPGPGKVCSVLLWRAPGGGGGTPIYGLYRYVPRDRVWFLRFSVLK